MKLTTLWPIGVAGVWRDAEAGQAGGGRGTGLAGRDALLCTDQQTKGEICVLCRYTLYIQYFSMLKGQCQEINQAF